MKNSNVSRSTYTKSVSDQPMPSRAEIIRTACAVTLAVALLATGAIALPSLSPVESAPEITPTSVAPLEPQILADIEGVHREAGMLAAPIHTVATIAKSVPSATLKVARVTKAVTRPIADGVESIPANVVRATAHEAIKMKKGLLPLIPSKFARAQDGVMIPVSLTQYCVQGETRRGRQTRHGIVAADPRIFPLSRYVEVFLGTEYLGRYLVDDTGGNVLGATLDIWNPDCREAARFGRHWGSAMLVAREVESVPNDTLVPTRWDGLAKR